MERTEQLTKHGCVAKGEVCNGWVGRSFQPVGLPVGARPVGRPGSLSVGRSVGRAGRSIGRSVGRRPVGQSGVGADDRSVCQAVRRSGGRPIGTRAQTCGELIAFTDSMPVVAATSASIFPHASKFVQAWPSSAKIGRVPATSLPSSTRFGRTLTIFAK